MATDAVSICNSALAKVGKQAITSLSDTTISAALCNQLYNVKRRELLRSHPWKFALKRQTLSASTVDPVWGLTYAYPLPSDCLRVLDVEDNDVEWRVEQHESALAVITDNASCKILFIQDVENTSLFDANFDEALALSIAMDLAIPLTAQNSLMDSLERRFRAVLAQARSFSAQQGSVQSVQAEQWLVARY